MFVDHAQLLCFLLLVHIGVRHCFCQSPLLTLHRLLLTEIDAPTAGFYDVQALAEWLLTQRSSPIKTVYQRSEEPATFASSYTPPSVAFAHAVLRIRKVEKVRFKSNSASRGKLIVGDYPEQPVQILENGAVFQLPPTCASSAGGCGSWPEDRYGSCTGPRSLTGYLGEGVQDLQEEPSEEPSKRMTARQLLRAQASSSIKEIRGRAWVACVGLQLPHLAAAAAAAAD
eukprot:1158239-Pelagomonas_calceolata.AAC.5